MICWDLRLQWVIYSRWSIHEVFCLVGLDRADKHFSSWSNVKMFFSLVAEIWKMPIHGSHTSMCQSTAPGGQSSNRPLNGFSEATAAVLLTSHRMTFVENRCWNSATTLRNVYKHTVTMYPDIHASRDVPWCTMQQTRTPGFVETHVSQVPEAGGMINSGNRSVRFRYLQTSEVVSLFLGPCQSWGDAL